MTFVWSVWVRWGIGSVQKAVYGWQILCMPWCWWSLSLLFMSLCITWYGHWLFRHFFIISSSSSYLFADDYPLFRPSLFSVVPCRLDTLWFIMVLDILFQGNELRIVKKNVPVLFFSVGLSPVCTTMHCSLLKIHRFCTVVHNSQLSLSAPFPIWLPVFKKKKRCDYVVCMDIMCQSYWWCVKKSFLLEICLWSFNFLCMDLNALCVCGYWTTWLECI